MRFAEPFALKEGSSPEEKLEQERLMFMELTQSMFSYFPLAYPHRLRCHVRSLSLGKLDGPVPFDQHDRGADQVIAVNRW